MKPPSAVVLLALSEGKLMSKKVVCRKKTGAEGIMEDRDHMAQVIGREKGCRDRE